MTSPTNVPRIALILASVGLIVFALTQMFSAPDEVAELEVIVENADLRLRSEEYVFQVFDPVDASLLTEGGGAIGERLALTPGEYDLRVSVPGVWPPQTATRRALSLPGGQRTSAAFSFSYGELEIDTDPYSEPGELVKVQVFTESDDDTPLIAFTAGETVRLAEDRYRLRVVRTVDTREKQVRWLDDIVIEPGRRRQLAVAFERGLLIVGATNAGEQIPPSDGTVEIFAAGDVSRRIIESGVVNAPIPLPSGVYDLTVTYDASMDRPVRDARSVTIADGQTHDIDVEFDSGEIVVRATTAAGEPFAQYDAYTYLYRRDDHRSAIGYLPAGQPLRASAGRYDIRANLFRSADRPDVWMRDVEIVANETREIPVTFDVGTLVLRVVDDDGREYVGDEYAVTVYPPQDASRPLHRMPAGTPVRLSIGPIRLRVENTYTGADEWRTAEVVSGETVEVAILHE